MQNVTAVLSMLHEPADRNSATRTFRQDPVLAWTLERLCRARHVGTTAIICWNDQLEDVKPIAAEHSAHVLAKTPRVNLPTVQCITAARKFTDGWRGGLHSTCDFDLGFHGPYVNEVRTQLASDAVLLVDPAAGLVDPAIIDALIEHAREREAIEICFTQAAPGLAGVLLRPKLLEQLAAAGVHPGRLLHYLPEQPVRDPIGGDGCVAVPAPVARTTHHFKLDSDRQINRIAQAAVNLNGELLQSDAEELLRRLDWSREVDTLPREIVLELNTRRNSSPIYWPGKQLKIDRPDMSLELAARIIGQLSEADDIRLTLGGVGDPLLHDGLFDVIDLAAAAGVHAVHVETDLLAPTEIIDRLGRSDVDVVSVNLPAMTPATYQAVMGINAFAQVVENIRVFVVARHERGRGVPLVVPVFKKCTANIGEMELWYDQWLRAVGSAVIEGPSDFAGQIATTAVADMSPPKRSACRRISSRMTILSDGSVISCEQDVLGRQGVGDLNHQSIKEVWSRGLESLRTAHAKCDFANAPLCAACREWHRP
jgi:hypothetical protein